MSDEIEVVVGSVNLWADIGRPDAEAMFARAQLMSKLTDLIRERGLTQKKAAQLLGTTQPTISDLMRGKIDLFSLDRLIGFLKALDQDVEIVVKARSPAESDREVRLAS